MEVMLKCVNRGTAQLLVLCLAECNEERLSSITKCARYFLLLLTRQTAG